MKILYLSSFVPYPLRGGGCLRLHDMVSSAVQEHEVLFASVTREPIPTEEWPLSRRFVSPPAVVRVGDDATPASEVTAVIDDWHLVPLGVRRIVAREAWVALARMPLEQIDVVHIVGTALVPYALAIKARAPRARLVLDLHRVDWHARLRSVASDRRWWTRRSGWRAAWETVKWYWFQRRAIGAIDKVLVCSEVDGARVAGWTTPDRVEVVPNGAAVPESLPTSEPVDSQDLVFTGAMLFDPNIEAACYFVRDIWPRVRQSAPQAKFWIVGKDPSEAVRQLHNDANGVVVTGEVPDIVPYLQRCVAAVVPLKNGGGTRLKILEAMAAGRAVVSTSVGAEGLDVTSGQNILIADEPSTFAAHCIAVLHDPDFRHRLADGGRRLVAERYDTRVMQARLRECYGSLKEPTDHSSAA